MATRYSLTIQIVPGPPGHAAVVVNEPSGQTYAGFGPKQHHQSYGEGKFDVHTVRPYGAPPLDYSSVVGEGSYKTFTIPISEEQAKAAREEIGKIQTERPWYNVWRLDPRVCTTIVNRIAKAAGLGDDLLYTLPSRSMQFATDVESASAANPKAKFMIDGAGRPVRIPDALHDVQQDYASVGGGYDTPSERLGHMPGGPAGSAPLVPPANSGSPAPARPALPPAAPNLPPLPFAPETPQNFGPFTLPSPLSFGTSSAGGAVKKPGGIPGMMIDAGLVPN